MFACSDMTLRIKSIGDAQPPSDFSISFHCLRACNLLTLNLPTVCSTSQHRLACRVPVGCRAYILLTRHNVWQDGAAAPSPGKETKPKRAAQVTKSYEESRWEAMQGEAGDH